MSEFNSKDEIVGKIKDAGSLKYLLSFTRENRFQFIIAILMLVVSTVLSISTARLIGELVEKGLTEKKENLAWLYAGIVVLFEGSSIVLVWKGRQILAKAATHSLLLIRKKLFHHIHELPISYYDREPQGRTITRMTHDVEGIENFLTGSVGRMATGIFSFMIAIMAMLLTDLKFGLMLSLSMIPSMVILFGTRGINRDLNRSLSKATSKCNSKLSEFINSLPVIRVYGLEGWSGERYFEVVEEYRYYSYAMNGFFAWTRPMILFLCELPLIVLFYFGGTAVIDGELGVGIFVAFMGYCNRFSSPLMMLSREISVIQQAFTSAERVTTFLQARTEEQTFGKNKMLVPEKLKGEITFDSVEMSYDGVKPVIKKISFEIKPGEKIGMVGRTGSGKTTTVSLLSRLYDYQSGKIFLDDFDLKDLSRDHLRENIGFVSQDVIIFKGSLKENLLCERQMSEMDVKKACEQTGLLNVMQRNHMTLDSEILDQGANLSAGEKQLISLTRVLLSNPKILVLDEATASIDPYYESLIQQAVDNIMSDRTCLIIAHRLATLRSCDRIFVFQNGELKEQGSHAELLDKRGIFTDLMNKSEKHY